MHVFSGLREKRTVGMSIAERFMGEERLMNQSFAIIIADRNRHIREFLKREFEADGYLVLLAKDEAELIELMTSEFTPDLVILDLDVPFCEGPEILENIMHNQPCLPIIVHTFLTEYSGHREVLKAAAFLEKTGTNVNDLKKIVSSVLHHFYPSRFGQSSDNT